MIGDMWFGIRMRIVGGFGIRDVGMEDGNIERVRWAIWGFWEANSARRWDELFL